MTIGERIAYLRVDSGMSQEALAEMLSVSRQSVSKWEVGDAIPGLDKIRSIAAIFNVTFDELLSEDGTFSRKKPYPVLNFTGSEDNKYFGTDGFRGEANVTLTSKHAYLVGRFLGWYFGRSSIGGRRARIVIGKDTRRSSYMLEYALIAGICSSGADAYMLHVTTTPGVSYITRIDGFSCGVMITASHNPYVDNGIKIINSLGEKIEDEVTGLIELYLDGELSKLGIEGDDLPYAVGEGIGSIVDYTAGRNRYIGYLISLAAHSFRGLRIGLDTANGASWSIARAVFDALGAELYLTGNEPNGVNINRGVGSTHIDNLISLVKRNRLDVGFAFDGDADRCIAVDSAGNVIDGDKILYVLAMRLKERDALTGNAVALTVMSNAGLIEALRAEGIDCEITPVGDRFIYERIKSGGYALGGEQSGHVIIKKYSTTGDGILTALMLTEEMLDRKRPLSDLARAVTVYPSLTVSVRVENREEAVNSPRLTKRIEEIRESIKDAGKLLVRKSGTEPVIRVSCECKSEDECKKYVDELVELIKEIGATGE